MEGISTAVKEGTKYILAFGDSLTKGFYMNGIKYHPYTNKFNSLLVENEFENYKAFPSGVNGETTKSMLDRLKTFFGESSKSPFKYSIIIIFAGINDLGYSSADKIVENIMELHNIARNGGVNFTVLVTLPENECDKIYSFYTERRQEANDFFRSKVKGTENVFLCDLDKEIKFSSMSKEDKEKYWDDGLHFSPAGYDLIGEILFNTLKETNLLI